jgi:tetratricopeptide (TPR) repeat protein
VPKAPAPTPAQLGALAELQREAERYESDARDYRNTMTRIIQHHYQEKKKRVLTALDREIDTENKTLKEARKEAIARLEAFVGRYSGPNADKINTPDAMFRLAALYEERARDIAAETPVAPGTPPPEPDLGPAIAYYKRIVREYPDYRELAGVFYYLGHALNDSGRLDEAQQVWRSLVCRNRYSYPVPPDPKDPAKDSIARLPQDHDPDFWLGWLSRHPEPLDKKRGAKDAAAKKAPRGKAAPAETTRVDDEEEFKNPFPDDCQPIAQKVDPGDAPRYIGEVWWRIADYHFDEVDPWGGPYNLARAEAAYNRALKFDKPPVYDVSMYKLAWTFFKQQRYETAVKQFIDLLNLTDKREAETGNAGADFRNEAYAYIAGSVTYLDFKGPPSGDPFIPRNDVFDLYNDPAQIEEAMHPAIERIQDPNLIPQDKKWTIEIYKALGFEFKEYNQLHNLIELDELILKKWPLHRDAPIVQNQIALVYEQLALGAKGAEAESYAAKALQARGKLINYVEQPAPAPIPPWIEAMKEDPEAIRAAEQLVHGGLRRAAADHTNAARRWVREARGTTDENERELAFQKALYEYQAAAIAWGSYLKQDENAEDAYESRFWLADSYTSTVLVKAELGKVATADEVALAQKAARDVRDSNENDSHLQPAAIMIVNAAQAVVRANYKAHEKSGGSQGFPEIKEVKTEKYEENGEKKERVVKQDVPQAITDMVTAFDEYIALVPLDKEPDPKEPNHDRYAYLAGEVAFLYGQFDDAKRRLTPIYQGKCGTRPGFDAWKKLTTIAFLEGDFDMSTKLAKAAKEKSCAPPDDPIARKYEEGLTDDVIKSGFYKEAYAAFDKASKMQEDSPERKKLWERAAILYEEALKAAPDREEAPEAAINGAIAYKQVGNYDKAISMYELFIGAYGKDETLDKLKGPEPEKYAKRVRFLKQAYDALAESYVLFFDYRKAAQTFDKISSIQRPVPPPKEKELEKMSWARGFDESANRDAAQNAVFLYLNIGDHDRVEATKKRFYSMNPPKAQQAEIDWLIAQGDLKGWDASAPDRADNRNARLRATASMEKFYNIWSKDSAGQASATLAAAQAARMKRAGNEEKGAAEWCANTIKAFESFKSGAPKDDKGRNTALGSAQADAAAECEYRAIDEDLKKNFDYDAGKHRYAGFLVDVKKEFTEDVEKGAKGHYDRLQAVIEKYQSGRWSTAARSRQGSLYDSCRTGLFNAREPALKLYNDKEEALPLCKVLGKPKCSEVQILKELDKQCVEAGSEKACTAYDSYTAKRRTLWREERDKLLEAADRAMVAGYGASIVWGKAFKARVKEVDTAVGRLAFHTDIIGDDKLRLYTEIDALKDPASGDAFKYQDGMFLRMRRGQTADVPSNVMTVPLPANPQ